jgi:hypothetical protein
MCEMVRSSRFCGDRARSNENPSPEFVWSCAAYTNHWEAERLGRLWHGFLEEQFQGVADDL